jgi:hypothetical protein
MDSQLSLDKLDINRDINVDIINSICRYTDFDGFSTIKSAFQSSFDQDIEFIPETIISTRNETLATLDEQLSRGRPRTFDEIDDCIKYKSTNIVLELAMDIKNFTMPMASKLIFNEKFLKLYDTPLMNEYIHKIDKLYISFVFRDTINHFQALLALQVRESYIYWNRNNNEDMNMSMNFREIYEFLVKKNKSLKVEDLTLSSIDVHKLSTTEHLTTLSKLTIINCSVYDCVFDNLDTLSFNCSRLYSQKYYMKNIREIDLFIKSNISTYPIICDITNVRKLKIVIYTYGSINFINTESLEELIIECSCVTFDSLINVKKLSIIPYCDTENDDYTTIINRCPKLEELTILNSIKCEYNRSQYLKLECPELLHFRSLISINIELDGITNKVITIHGIRKNSSSPVLITCSGQHPYILSNIKCLINTNFYINGYSFTKNLKLYVSSSNITYKGVRCITYYENIYYEYVIFDVLFRKKN